MPKIVMKVDRRAHTRSKTLAESKNTDSSIKKHAQNSNNTDKGQQSESVSNAKSKIQKLSTSARERRYFTILEDSTIL